MLRGKFTNLVNKKTILSAKLVKKCRVSISRTISNSRILHIGFYNFPGQLKLIIYS